MLFKDCKIYEYRQCKKKNVCRLMLEKNKKISTDEKWKLFTQMCMHVNVFKKNEKCIDIGFGNENIIEHD